MNGNYLIKKIFIFVVLLSVFTCVKVNASCSSSEKNSLIQKAYNVKFDYELSDSNMNKNERLFTITISNLIEGIYAEYSPYIYKYYATNATPGIEKMDTLFKSDNSYVIKFYGDTKNCEDVFLIKRTVDIPKYNIYSEKEECKEYKDFKLCNRWYQGNIESDKYFKEELEKYKSELTKKKEQSHNNPKVSLINKLINFYKNNLFISVGITILVIILFVFGIILIIKRNKKKIKIDL